MDKYKSHKVVEAALISDINQSEKKVHVLNRAGEMSVITPTDDWFARHRAATNAWKGGYYVRYEGGYDSWSPADVFAEGYSLVDS